ncbi:MAG: hypothetical protein Q8K94_06125 [Moraxellaceae bacterium]|nr:hypothetical protein [Moraxellaceae bacterium]
MNKEEKQVLHGLYFYREMIGEEHSFTEGEIAWLIHTPLPRGRNWQDASGNLKTLSGKGDWPEEYELAGIRVLRPLTYLNEAGYRVLERRPYAGDLHIAVTRKGADYARALNSWYGRIGVWYVEHKDGIVGLLITILVSALTAIITSSN